MGMDFFATAQARTLGDVTDAAAGLALVWQPTSSNPFCDSSVQNKLSSQLASHFYSTYTEPGQKVVATKASPINLVCCDIGDSDMIEHATARRNSSLNSTNTGTAYGFTDDMQLSNPTTGFLQPPSQPGSFLPVAAAHAAHNLTVGSTANNQKVGPAGLMLGPTEIKQPKRRFYGLGVVVGKSRSPSTDETNLTNWYTLGQTEPETTEGRCKQERQKKVFLETQPLGETVSANRLDPPL
ncbi:unnamed protein product [Schistocephalus solidus]|uniref:Protein grainyhead n=1 Tax=Schistocephalus solidus TaxID=70667 RepID=A0A183SX64_SCHSO|nr:unnamed protein product [Schistocephalus solidus]